MSRDLKPGGLIIADEGEFGARNLAKAGYDGNPLDDDTLAKWQVIRLNISQLTLDAVKPFGLGNKEALRCKNMWTLGLALWMFDRDRGPIVDWLKAKFAKAPELAEANIAALNAGHAYGETAEMDGHVAQHIVAAGAGRARPLPHRHRRRGDLAGAGRGLRSSPGCRCSSAAIRSRRRSAILHHLSRLKEYGVTTFQAEDEIAAIGAAIGASFAGSLGVTSSSGPGIALKTRGDGPRDHDRAAAGHHQLAARRPFDRPADQDRAVGPLSGGLWPQWRRAAAGDRRALARRRLRLRDRGRAGSRSSI